MKNFVDLFFRKEIFEKNLKSAKKTEKVQIFSRQKKSTYLALKHNDL